MTTNNLHGHSTFVNIDIDIDIDISIKVVQNTLKLINGIENIKFPSGKN